MNPSLISIQIVRAIAALSVVLWHLPAPFGELNAPRFLLFGYAGVDFFFVVSGFIISYITERGFSLRPFLVRRAIRILPFYALFSLGFIAILAYVGRPPNLAYVLHSILAIPMQGLPVLQPGWSLEHEFIFYLAAAAVFALSRRRALPVVLALLFLVGVLLHTGIRAATGQTVWDFHLFSLYQFDFLLGVLICQQRNLLPRLGAVAPIGLGIAGTLLTAHFVMRHGVGHVATQPGGWEGLVRVVGYGLSGGALIAGLLNMEPLLRTMRWLRPLVVLGDASFALYLSHLLVFAVMYKAIVFLGPSLYVLGLALSVGAAVAFAVIFYIAVERPFLRLQLPRRSIAVERPASAP